MVVVLLAGFLALAGIPLYILWFYLTDARKLRRFPSPSIAAFTPLWLMYQSYRVRRFVAVNEAHQKLGPVVRIAPNHVSFTSPSAYKEIYNFKSQIIKDDFYEIIGAGHPSMAQTASKSVHAAKRKNLSHVFSGKEITAMEPRVMMVAEKLCDEIVKQSEGEAMNSDTHRVTHRVFDLRPWLNMASFDAITSMFWSNRYGLLDQGNDTCPAQLSDGRITQVKAMDTYHSAVHFSACLAHLPRGWYNLGRILLKYTHGQMAGEYFSGMARYLVAERLKIEPSEPDLFAHLPVQASEKRPIPMSFDELHAESTTMLDAGNDTTQTSLTNCIYQLARHPSKQACLRSELSVLDIPSGVPSYAALQKIPYLRACLDESFRCRTPLRFGLPRKVVEASIVIDGHEILPGTTVSAPLDALHMNEALFQDASAFIPERWLAESDVFATSKQEQRNLKDYVHPFSLGSRACIGRNLAYMELSIVIAALVLRFEWELAVEGDMVTVERFNSNPKELMVKATRLVKTSN